MPALTIENILLAIPFYFPNNDLASPCIYSVCYACFMGEFSHTNSNQFPTKGNAMPEKDNNEFEFIDANSIEFVKRGRKSNVSPKLVNALSQLTKGKALAIPSMKLDPNASNYANEKARISSQIRTACRMANLEGFRILWAPNGVPQVVA